MLLHTFQYNLINPLIVGFPGVVGCLDGCHIRISKPTVSGEAYFNRKKFYSLNTLLVCDSQEQITFYSVGSPGSFHDARVYRRSGLEDKLVSLPAHLHVLGGLN
jgi:hypothetical protein